MTTDKGFDYSTAASQTSRRRLPGVLRILPETLPFYPYCQASSLPSRGQYLNPRKQKKYHSEECLTPPLYADENPSSNSHCNIGGGRVIANMPLQNNTPTTPTNNSNCKAVSFTLFFFADSTNRHSLSAVPAVSSWFQHALYGSTNDDTGGSNDNNSNNNNNINENRVICIPNNPLPFEINVVHDPSSDPMIHATIHSETETKSSQIMLHPMLIHTGFYHIQFHHPKRLPLIRLLNATRVPSIIVVNNCNGRIVTQYGWEAVEREYLGKLKQGIDYGNKGWVGNRNPTDEVINEDNLNFESQVVDDWRKGKSGLPVYWHWLSWIL